MSPHLNSNEILFAPSQKDVEMFELISMIVRKNLPLSIVEDEDYRYVCCSYFTNYIMVTLSVCYSFDLQASF